MSKEDKKFQCNILDYVEKKNPEVFKAIAALCLKGAFKPRRDTGVTFIMPAASTIKDITPGIYSDKEEEYEKSWSVMQAHILNDCYESAAEFKDEDVLELDTGFKMIPKRKGLSIYIASGPIPTDGPAAAERESRQKAEGSGAKKTKSRGEFDRAKFVKSVETDFLAKDDGGACYLHAVLALMEHLGADKDSADYKRAVVTLDMSPLASLYLLLEPFRTGKLLLSDSVLESWEKKTCDLQGEAAVTKYISYLSVGEKFLSKDLDEKIDSARWNIISNGISRHNLPKAIGAQYAKVVLYSDDGLKSFFTPEYKEWQDLARYHINYMFTYFESSFGNHKHEFSEVQSSIMSIMGSDERFSTKTWSPLASKEDFLAGPVAFIESGSFLYYPGEKKHVRGSDDDDDVHPMVATMARSGTGGLEDLKTCAGCCQ
jgi:hypothetical protein